MDLSQRTRSRKRPTTQTPMRISFDVDDTLVLYDPAAVLEMTVPWWWRWRYTEPLRHGTRNLMLELLKRKCELWIYTTSYRHPRYMTGWFRSFGIPLTGVINQDRHDQVVKK